MGAIAGSGSRGQPKRHWLQDEEDWLKMTINDTAKLMREKHSKHLEGVPSSSRLPVNDGWHLT